MIDLAWPWALAALPLPVLAALLTPRARPAVQAALRMPFLAYLGDCLAPRRRESLGRSIMAAMGWMLLVGAAARPVWVGTTVQLPVSGRDLMLAVDISGSMRRPDMRLDGAPATRLQGVKSVATRFIERRGGDRIGLILFGSQPYLRAPLTFDRATVATMLDEAEIGLAGRETAIGDAIGLAVKHLREAVPVRPADEASRPVVVLMTDGANRTGELAPQHAAELAAQAGIKVYTIGIGSEGMDVQGFFGARRVNPSQDLDAEALRDIAATTGARYFRATGTQSLAEIYSELDRLAPRAGDSATYRPQRELFAWPLGAALLVTFMLVAMRVMPTVMPNMMDAMKVWR